MPAPTHAADDLAATLESAGFVRLVTRADADALAAGGILAGALTERETPFQFSVGRTVRERTARVADGGADEVTLAIGSTDADVPELESDDRPAALAACALATELEVAPDPVLALAGAVAAGVEPGAGETEWLLERARETGRLERRPGVAVPTADPVDGLAHSTRCRAPWSGSPEATREALSTVALDDELDDDAHRTVGSLVALDVVGAEDATERAAVSVGRFLRPYAAPESAFETVGGYADVLAATAQLDPGTGVALAMGHDARESALDVWRAHGRESHEALSTAATRRYDGLFVVDVDGGPVETVARLAAAFRSPEPLALAVGDGEAAVASSEPRSLATQFEAIARALADARAGDGAAGVEYDAGRRRGYLQYGSEVDETTLVDTVREHL
ncbi:exonuclease [Natrononativus amylolyticus]|uniref:exonuclease n=1 Tax=Natrononativus amylolyticus TaxID=2963434 RepID=UPI0020CF77B0|nr:exonuclease [Natrononativus amylolyticus]